VLHTINPRLHPTRSPGSPNHAEDQVLCFDTTFLPLVQAVHARCPTIRQFVPCATPTSCRRTAAFPTW